MKKNRGEPPPPASVGCEGHLGQDLASESGEVREWPGYGGHEGQWGCGATHWERLARRDSILAMKKGDGGILSRDRTPFLPLLSLPPPLPAPLLLLLPRAPSPP